MDSTPRPGWNLVPAALMTIGTISFFFGSPEWAWILLGAALYVLACGAALVLWIVAVNRSREDLYYAMADFAHRFEALDKEGRQALGLKYPHLRIRWQGERLEYFEDTTVPMAFVAEFVSASTYAQTMAKRLTGDGTDRRRYYVELRDWLEANDYILGGRNAVTESWPWRSGMYERFCDMYAPRKFANLGTIDPSPAFVPVAEESETP